MEVVLKVMGCPDGPDVGARVGRQRIRRQLARERAKGMLRRVLARATQLAQPHGAPAAAQCAPVQVVTKRMIGCPLGVRRK